ncbi:hypothetical protein D3C75_1017850 [compost metagenome]
MFGDCRTAVVELVATHNEKRLRLLHVELFHILQLALIPANLWTFAFDAVAAIENDVQSILATNAQDVIAIFRATVFKDVVAKATHRLAVVTTIT